MLKQLNLQHFAIKFSIHQKCYFQQPTFFFLALTKSLFIEIVTLLLQEVTSALVHIPTYAHLFDKNNVMSSKDCNWWCPAQNIVQQVCIVRLKKVKIHTKIHVLKFKEQLVYSYNYNLFQTDNIIFCNGYAVYLSMNLDGEQ